MLKKTIKYNDFNDVEQTEEVYFNLSKSELTKLEARESTIAKDGEVSGGLRDRIQKVMDGGSGREIIEMIEMLIRESYGERSEDGKRFSKSEAISQDFMNSAAYDALFMELVMDAEAAAEFFNKIMPSDIQEQMKNDPEYATHMNLLRGAQATPAPNTEAPQTSPEPASNVVTPDPHPAELTDEERAMLERLQKKAGEQ